MCRKYKKKCIIVCGIAEKDILTNGVSDFSIFTNNSGANKNTDYIICPITEFFEKEKSEKETSFCVEYVVTKLLNFLF